MYVWNLSNCDLFVICYLLFDFCALMLEEKLTDI